MNKPSAGAVRAARAIAGNTLQEDPNVLQDAVLRKLASIIDQESGLADAVEALRAIVAAIDQPATYPADLKAMREWATHALARIEGKGRRMTDCNCDEGYLCEYHRMRCSLCGVKTGRYRTEAHLCDTCEATAKAHARLNRNMAEYREEAKLWDRRLRKDD